MVTWLVTHQGPVRMEDPFTPCIHVGGQRHLLDELREILAETDGVCRVGMVERLQDIRNTVPAPVLEVGFSSYPALNEVARSIDARGRYRDFTLYDVDQSLPFRYLVERGLFPNARVRFELDRPGHVRAPLECVDDPLAISYIVPPYRTLWVDRPDLRTYTPEEPIRELQVGDVTITGSDDYILEELQALVRDLDPDIVFTRKGDSFLMPYLQARAERAGMPLSLDRETKVVGRAKKREKSYFTYGRIVYKPASHFLKGRAHIPTSSFLQSEGGLFGLIDLSRISGLPIQQLSRLSPGTAISAMQMRQAASDGYLIMWKKNIPESFKTARQLMTADRGGFIFDPKVGLHENIVEMDFTSMYPFIIMNENISPETLHCDCCPDSRRVVPGLGYPVCEKRHGLIPRVLVPVIERRRFFKRKAKEKGPLASMFKQRSDTLKWLLVTCLDGNTLVPHVKDGKTSIAPISSIVDPLMEGPSCEVNAPPGLDVFGIDSSYRSARVPVEKVFRFPSPGKMLRVRLRHGRVLTVTPDHPCFVIDAGRLVVRLAEDLRVGDHLPVVGPDPGEVMSFSEVVSIEEVTPVTPYVYCLKVGGPVPGFVVEGNVLTHNCFGYTGYRNARFGRIECHESITAFAREILVDTKDIAEQHGFEILHGIVDSLWLKGDTDRAKEAADAISASIGIPLEVEDVYAWIVFLPNKGNGVGALNRYYGMNRKGEFKVRGVELRRRDTTDYIRDLQQDILDILGNAQDGAEFLETIPDCMTRAREAATELRSGTVDLSRLVVTKTVTKPLEEYRVVSDQASALFLLNDAGISIHPGQQVRFVILDATSKVPSKRVAPELLASDGKGTWTFPSEDSTYDPEAYVRLAARSIESLLRPFGWTEERILDVMG